MQSLKKDIEEYTPLEETGVEQIKVLMIGQVGAGKSSFFNTINSIFKGTITNQAPAGSAGKSLTNKVYHLMFPFIPYYFIRLMIVE